MTDRSGYPTARAGTTSSAQDEGATPPGWPFFAPSADDSVARALALAGLQPAEHLVDLGCGDGQVLLAAARLGARVTGVECDPELADQASSALRSAGVDQHRGRIVVADLFDPAVLDPDADVVGTADVLFGYLSPATLQRLWPRLRARRGTRLVTIDFAVPDVMADALDGTPDRGAAYLYRLPGRRRRAHSGRMGWPHPGSLCIQPPEVSSLTSLDVVHPGGAVVVKVDVPLAAVAAVAQGCDTADRGRTVALDLRWTPQDRGVVAHGNVAVEGVGAHHLTVVFADDHHGQWDLSDEGCATVAERLDECHIAGPPTAAELLDLLDAEL